MLKADGEQFREGNYEKVRKNLLHAIRIFARRGTGGQAPNAEISEQRIRTWKAAFEEMGLLTVDDSGAIRLSFSLAKME